MSLNQLLIKSFFKDPAHIIWTVNYSLKQIYCLCERINAISSLITCLLWWYNCSTHLKQYWPEMNWNNLHQQQWCLFLYIISALPLEGDRYQLLKQRRAMDGLNLRKYRLLSHTFNHIIFQTMKLRNDAISSLMEAFIKSRQFLQNIFNQEILCKLQLCMNIDFELHLFLKTSLSLD